MPATKDADTGMLTKGISIDGPLFTAAAKQAKAEGLNLSAFIRRAIQRDLQTKEVTQHTPQALGAPSDLMEITEVCERLKLSVWTVRKLTRRRGHPLRLAKSKIGKQKPMHFVRSKIEEIERAA